MTSTRYRTGSDPALLTGVQAIARFLVEQRALDQRSGRDIRFFVSGYQGSPLGGVDKMLLGMPAVLRENAIHFQPGLNEELAATSVWEQPDRAARRFHGPRRRRRRLVRQGPRGSTGPPTRCGTWPCMACTRAGEWCCSSGDDPAAKFSTVPAVSERSLAALGIPVLLPRNAEEVVTFGLHAVALAGLVARRWRSRSSPTSPTAPGSSTTPSRRWSR